MFYNCGHIHKQGPQALLDLQPSRARKPADRRLGLRPLPSSARYAATLGFDFRRRRPASSTPPGASSAASSIPMRWSSKRRRWCALGVQVPRGRPAPSRRPHQPRHLCARSPRPIARHRKAGALSRAGQAGVATLPSSPPNTSIPSARATPCADDGAAQVLQELKLPFDVIDPQRDVRGLPAHHPARRIPVDCRARRRGSRRFAAQGSKLLLTGAIRHHPRWQLRGRRSASAAAGPPVAFNPSYHPRRP